MKPRVLKHDVMGSGDPVVLIPGGLTGWVSWIPHQQRLSSRGFRAIRVQPIHNELGSAGERGDHGYTRKTELESLVLTLDALDIDRAHFAGWSGGGKALIDFTLAHHDRVTTLTLVEPAAYWILKRLGAADTGLLEFTRFVNSLSGRTVTEDDLALFLAKAGFASDPAMAREHPYWDRALPHRMTLSWLSDSVMESDSSIDDLDRIVCPTLLTKGTTTESWERRLVDILGEHLPNSHVVEMKGSHAHHIESIDSFMVELEAQLERESVARADYPAS